MSQDNFDNLFYGASSVIRERANHLRKTTTDAEQLLWKNLRNRKLGGFKFRRQHPIDIFIADFYCHEIKLVIEIDGEIHKYQKEYDIGRTAELERFGIKVIRFSNDDVLLNVVNVCEAILKACKRAEISNV